MRSCAAGGPLLDKYPACSGGAFVGRHGALRVLWSDTSAAPSRKQHVASEATCACALAVLGDPADAQLYPCAIRHQLGSTGRRPWRLPVPGLRTCGRVLRTGPSPAGRVGKSWTTSLLTTTCPHSRASRPQGPQAPTNNSFNSNRKRIYAGVCISWVRFREYKWVRFPERRGHGERKAKPSGPR